MARVSHPSLKKVQPLRVYKPPRQPSQRETRLRRRLTVATHRAFGCPGQAVGAPCDPCRRGA